MKDLLYLIAPPIYLEIHFKDATWDSSLSWFDDKGNLQNISANNRDQIKAGWKLLNSQKVKQGLPATKKLISRIWDPRVKDYPSPNEAKQYEEQAQQDYGAVKDTIKDFTTLYFYDHFYFKNNLWPDRVLSNQTIEINDILQNNSIFNINGHKNWHRKLGNENLKKYLN